MDFKMKDNMGDRIEVDTVANVGIAHFVSDDGPDRYTYMVLSPKKARKFARKLLKAADIAEAKIA